MFTLRNQIVKPFKSFFVGERCSFDFRNFFFLFWFLSESFALFEDIEESIGSFIILGYFQLIGQIDRLGSGIVRSWDDLLLFVCCLGDVGGFTFFEATLDGFILFDLLLLIDGCVFTDHGGLIFIFFLFVLTVIDIVYFMIGFVKLLIAVEVYPFLWTTLRIS